MQIAVCDDEKEVRDMFAEILQNAIKQLEDRRKLESDSRPDLMIL